VFITLTRPLPFGHDVPPGEGLHAVKTGSGPRTRPVSEQGIPLEWTDHAAPSPEGLGNLSAAPPFVHNPDDAVHRVRVY
jgi:hypothetical protein